MFIIRFHNVVTAKHIHVVSGNYELFLRREDDAFRSSFLQFLADLEQRHWVFRYT